MELPWAAVEKPYQPPPLEVRSSGACPIGGTGFTIVSGALPPGIQFSKLGYLSGTPLRTGSWEFAVRVSNGCTWTARHYTLVVNGAPMLRVTPEKLDLAGTALAEKIIQVSSTWPKLNYSVTSSEQWLKAEPERGYTPREGSALSSDFVRIRVDSTGMKPGRYAGKLMFSAWQAANHPAVIVEVTVPEPAIERKEPERRGTRSPEQFETQPQRRP
jgi:hypothetical protein